MALARVNNGGSSPEPRTRTSFIPGTVSRAWNRGRNRGSPACANATSSTQTIAERSQRYFIGDSSMEKGKSPGIAALILGLEKETDHGGEVGRISSYSELSSVPL